MVMIKFVTYQIKLQNKESINPWVCKRKLTPLEKVDSPLFTEFNVAFTETTSRFTDVTSFISSYDEHCKNDITNIAMYYALVQIKYNITCPQKGL